MQPCIKTKTCRDCKQVKSTDEFYPRKTRGPGHFCVICKECAKKRHTKRYHSNAELYRKKQNDYHKLNRFKVALSQSRNDAKKKGHAPCTASELEIKEAFDGKCAICGALEAQLNRKLCLDHDHKTGAFRGFLCGYCNNGLGEFFDSEERLINALHYLMNSNKKEV